MGGGEVRLLHHDNLHLQGHPPLPTLLGRGGNFSNVLDMVKPVIVTKEGKADAPVTPTPAVKSVVLEVIDALEQCICNAGGGVDAALSAEALEDRVGLGFQYLWALRRRFDSFCQQGSQALSEDDFWRLVEVADRSFTREASAAYFHAFNISTASRFIERQTRAAWAAQLGSLVHGVGQVGAVTPSVSSDLAIAHAAAAAQLGERRLVFSDFARGVCAADPHDTSPMLAKAPYFCRFFSVAPKLCFKFETSLLRIRWSDLRSTFLVAYHGGPDFICLHALYMDNPELFRLVCQFL